MKIAFIVLVFSIMSNSLAFAVVEEKSQYTIKAGILKRDAKWDYIVDKETTEIPLIYASENPNYYFGFTLHENNNATFTCQVIIEMPTPQEINVNAKEGFIKEHSKSVVGERTIWSSEKEKCYGYLYSALKFGVGDKQGLYRVKIYINELLLKVIDFTVKRNKLR